MPEISKRGERVPYSPFRKLVPYANEAKKRGVRVYHLNIGQPDIETPAKAIQQLKNTDLRVLAYSPAEGCATYRDKLVGYYNKFGIDISADEIIVTTGASEAIQMIMLTCLDRGEEIVIPEPFYANYNGFAQIADVNIRPITCKIEDAFALPDLEAFEQAITSKTKAIFITNPNNPTGRFYSKSDLMDIAVLVKKYDLFLFVDEVYREFCYDDNEFFSALNLTEINDKVIVLDSVSKRFSACGARIGALVTRNRDILETVSRYAKLRLSPPGLGQILSEALLEISDSYILNAKKQYNARRQLLFNRLQKMPGVTSYRPGGSFYCFARFPVEDAEEFCRWLLVDFSYRGATVMLSPGEGFYATPGLGKDEVRIAYVINCDDLESAMDSLEKGLETYLELKQSKKAMVES